MVPFFNDLERPQTQDSRSRHATTDHCSTDIATGKE